MRNTIAIVFLQGLALTGPAVQEEKRSPVPDENAHKEALKLVREVFKEEYLRRSTADRLALARKLLQQGIETQEDLAAQYALLQESRAIAADVGDLLTATRAVEELSRRFVVNALDLKCATLSTAGLASRSPDEFLAAANAMISLAEEAVRAQDIGVAEKALSSAASFAKGAVNPALAAKIDVRIKQLPGLKSRMALFKKAQEILLNNPDDPEANHLVGEQLSLVQEDWEKGLPFLAKGSNVPFKEAAALDLASPPEAAQQVEVGDAWWSLAEKEAEERKNVLRRRAAYWYEKAKGGLTGLNRAKVDKRLREASPPSAAGGSVRLKSGLIGYWNFDEAAGNSIRDASGGSNTGTLMNGVLRVRGKGGFALSFDGKDDYVSLGVAGLPAPNTPQTIAWFHLYPAAPSGPQSIITITDDIPSSGVQPGFKMGRVCVWQYGGTVLVSAPPPPANEWHHYAYAFDGASHRFYVDGDLKDTSKAPAQGANPKIFELGRWWGGGGMDYFKGLMDELRIYNRCLSAEDIRVLAGGR